jgi:hypothetical protein
MLQMLGRVAVLSAFSAGAISAQTPAPLTALDSVVHNRAEQNVVTAFSIRSGKLVLSSAANPGKTTLPDGTYTNELNTIIEIVDGKITRIQESSGAIVEVASIRVSRQGLIRVTPSTSALMAVSEMPFPSGTFRSEDGQNSFTSVLGRLTAFSIGRGVERSEQK